MTTPISLIPLVNQLEAHGETACPRAGQLANVPLIRRLEGHGVLTECPTGYSQPGATHYDGVGDYYKRVSNFTGLVDGKKGTASFWVSLPDEYPDGEFIFNNDQDYVLFNAYGASGQLLVNISGYHTGGGDPLVLALPATPSSAPAFVGDHFYHVMASWDLALGLGQLYIDDVSRLDSGAKILLDQTVGYNQPAWAAQKYLYGAAYEGIGCALELFFHPDYLDLSIEANRRKFISADLKPVSLGANGELPFGTPPIFYSPEGNGTNLGTGGDLTAFGAPSVCGSAP